jgi:biotin operon repressor
LLLSYDRVPTDNLPLTQEALSHMLGATRTNVTKAALTLKRSGLVQYRHGNIQILNRVGLEQRTCECYRTIAQEIGVFRAA